MSGQSGMRSTGLQHCMRPRIILGWLCRKGSAGEIKDIRLRRDACSLFVVIRSGFESRRSASFTCADFGRDSAAAVCFLDRLPLASWRLHSRMPQTNLFSNNYHRAHSLVARRSATAVLGVFLAGRQSGLQSAPQNIRLVSRRRSCSIATH
jgi:hypothetical protein